MTLRLDKRLLAREKALEKAWEKAWLRSAWFVGVTAGMS
jgi:hypothetical protein